MRPRGPAAQRAAFALCLIARFQLMRQMIGVPALVDANPEELARIMNPVFKIIIQGHTST
jgi:hypothetical protein